MNYAGHADFEGYYFEDSFVERLNIYPEDIIFDLTVALTPKHPEYRSPPPQEQHCYRRGRLIFRGVREPQIQLTGDPPAVDAEGLTDVGNIDAMEIDGRRYKLEGSWGSMRFQAGSAAVQLDPE
jgi:hypothetical protein